MVTMRGSFEASSKLWVTISTVVPASVDLPQKRHHLVRRLAVEVARRLVGQDDFGVVGERAGDGHPLDFTPAHPGREVVEPVAEPDAPEDPGRLPDTVPSCRRNTWGA